MVDSFFMILSHIFIEIFFISIRAEQLSLKHNNCDAFLLVNIIRNACIHLNHNKLIFIKKKIINNVDIFGCYLTKTIEKMKKMLNPTSIQEKSRIFYETLIFSQMIKESYPCIAISSLE